MEPNLLLLFAFLCAQVHARDVLLRELAADVDIVCTHPMFGPVSGKYGWHSLPLMYDQVRVADQARYECVSSYTCLAMYILNSSLSLTGAKSFLPSGSRKVAR